jgi:hypothetical protein
MDPGIHVAEVPMSRGGAWLTEAFALFRRNPVAWIGLCAGWLAIWFGLLMVPVFGPVIGNLLQPVFFAGFAIAAFKQTAGEPVVMRELFGGFKRNLRGLMQVGLIMVLVQLASLMLMRGLGLPTWPADKAFDVVQYAEMIREAWWIVLAGFSLPALASAALWFAPQLLVFHDMPVSHAIRWSVYAALANVGAMLLYGVLLVALLFFAWLPFGLGLLVMLPVMVISTYTGYRDVFEARAGAAAAAAQ